MFERSSSRNKRAKSSIHRKEVEDRSRHGKGVYSTIQFQTRSIERALAPIAAQVSQLIILNETAERKGGKLPNLIPFAQTVLRATEELVQVGHKMARDTDDEKLQREMPAVCDASIAAGRSMLMAVQRLQAEPLSEPARDNMVTAARRLLETTMKVLLISDEAEVNRILDTCDWVSEGLQYIRAVASMKELVITFKDFAESVLILCDLCDKRQQDLNDPEKKERIVTALSGLKRVLPLLNSSMQSYVKYPANVQAKASRDYSCNQVNECVKQITEVLTQDSSRGLNAAASDRPGQFAHNMEKLVELLSPNMRLKLDKGFKAVLEQTVRHGMSVAASSREPIRDEIVSICKQILQLRSEIMKDLEALRDNPSYSQLNSDFKKSCERLAHDLLTLENLVKSALIHQVVDAFTETTEPLDRLVKTSTVRLKEKGPLKEAICTKLLQPLDDAFHDHSDRILQMASFVAASCVDSNQGQEILALVNNMEQLDADVFPSCLAVRKDLTNKGAVEHLKLVRREWHSSLHQLMDIIDTLLETRRFLEVSESCLEKDVEECRQAGLISDAQLLSEAVGNIVGRCKRVLQVARQHQDKNEDAVYRNGLQIFISQLENALPLVKNGGHYLVGNIKNKRAMTALSEHNYHLLQCVHNLYSGLDISNHPDILSPLRGQVRGHQVTTSQESLDFLKGLPDESPTQRLHLTPKSRQPPRGHSPEDYLSKSVKYLSLLDSTPSFHLPSDAISTPHGASSIQPRHRDAAGIGNGIADDHLVPSRKITKDMIRRLDMAYPMNELMRALFTNQRDQVVLLCQKTREKVDLYCRLVTRMRNLKLDDQKFRSIDAKVNDLQKMTADLIHHFESSLHGNSSDKADAVIRAEKWSSHMTQVAAESRELIGWHGESCNMVSRHDGNDHMTTLQSQIEQVNAVKTDVMRLISVTVGWKESLQAADGGDTPTHAMHIQQLQSKASDWSRVTHDLHSLANECLISTDDRELADRLESLTLSWSVSTMELQVTLDDVIMGRRSRELVGIATAIMSGQEDQVMLEVKGLNVRCKKLMEQSRKAITSCGDTAKELDLNKTLKEMENCTSSLATSAISMATTLKGQGSSADGFRLQRINLLQREWIVKTQIVECMLEGLIIEMLIPLDRLTGTALAARQAKGPSRQQIMEEFHAQSEGLSQAVTKLKNDCAVLLQGVFNLPEKATILQSTDALSKITPGVVAKLRMMADNSSMSYNDELTSQKRDWACNAKALIHGINNLPGVDFALKQEMIRSLLQDHSPPASSASSTIMYPSPGGGVGGTFNPPTVPQLTPEQWRVLQSLPQHGIQLIHTPPTAASPYFHGNFQHHVTSGISTPNQAGTSPRLFEPYSSPRQQSATPHDLSPGRQQSLHHSNLGGRSINDQESPTKKASHSEGTPGPYRSQTLGIENTPRAQKLKSISTSSLQSANSTTAVSDCGSVKYSNSITAAALALQQETDRWEGDKNEIIKVARTMSQQMRILAKFARRHCCMEDKEELISTAKAVAANGLKIAKFADIIAKNCTDKRFAEELQDEAQHIPTFSTQLDIIASVKAATPDDLTSNAALVKNAENLMTAIVRTLKAAEAACVKGLKSLDNDDPSCENETREAKALTMQWKRKLHRHRLIEASTEDTNHLGLRKIKKNVSAPSLTEIVMP
ncbi:uncharacterized protein LOC129273364 [Lytechinus pictus]|uniref:uncharacterized protein LOC129273364 n=1 Tax=Lytechinus pictus TaxID=7653 RepID=UPI0030BA058E